MTHEEQNIEVISITSDEDDEYEEQEKLQPVTASKPKSQNYFLNEYEYGDGPDFSKRVNQDKVRPPKQQQQRQEVHERIRRNDVVYVLDDREEERFLIRPIRELCKIIIFGPDMNDDRPIEFPHDTLIELEEHLKTSLRNVSPAAETNVWRFAISQLILIKLAYAGTIKVSRVSPISSDNLLLNLFRYS